VLLARRGPNRRLRLLTFDLGCGSDVPEVNRRLCPSGRRTLQSDNASHPSHDRKKGVFPTFRGRFSAELPASLVSLGSELAMKPPLTRDASVAFGATIRKVTFFVRMHFRRDNGGSLRESCDSTDGEQNGRFGESHRRNSILRS